MIVIGIGSVLMCRMLRDQHSVTVKCANHLDGEGLCGVNNPYSFFENQLCDFVQLCVLVVYLQCIRSYSYVL